MVHGQVGAGTAAARYEMRMVLVTSLAIACLAMDRLASGVIGPFLIESLALSKTQLGSLYSVQAIAVAVMGLLIGSYSDRTGNRRKLLSVLLALSAMAAGAVLLAQTYVALLMLRLASGMALGAVSPIAQSLVTLQSRPQTLGRNIGIQTLLMFLVSQVMAPFVLPIIAARWGWQAGYAASAGPFLVLALAVLMLLRDRPAPHHDQPLANTNESDASDVRDAASAKLSAQSRRAVQLCLGIAACFMIWLVIFSNFLTVFLVEQWKVTPAVAGSMLGTAGIAGGVGGFVLPMLSDRWGRKRILVAGMAIGAVAPLATLFWSGPLWGLRGLLELGWLTVGCLPLYAVVIPGSSVPPGRVAATIALVIGTGEIVGGVGGPLAAGWLADRWGISAPFWLALGAICCCVCLAALLPKSVENARGASGDK